MLGGFNPQPLEALYNLDPAGACRTVGQVGRGLSAAASATTIEPWAFVGGGRMAIDFWRQRNVDGRLSRVLGGNRNDHATSATLGDAQCALLASPRAARGAQGLSQLRPML